MLQNGIIFKYLSISAICIGWWSFAQAQEQPISDPIEPEQFQDPLAPTLSPGRGALAPRRATDSTEEWGIQMALDYGYVGSASLTKGLGTATEQAVGVDDGKGGGCGGSVGDVFVGAFGKVLDHVGEELELFDEVGEFRGVDLGELGLQHGEAMKKIIHDLGGDPGGPALGKGGAVSARLQDLTEQAAVDF